MSISHSALFSTCNIVFQGHKFHCALTNCMNGLNGFITLLDSDLHLDSKPNGYIILGRTCSHCTYSDLDPTPYFYIGQESESKPDSVSESGNVLRPLDPFSPEESPYM